jgi:hypothetical protein
VSCEKEKIETPKAEVEVNKTSFSINESMEIRFTGSAVQSVIFTGDDTHNYELRNESNTGFVVNKDIFTYSYSQPGVYQVVCVASAYGDLASDLQRDTCSFYVTVIDDETEIERLSCPQILYDEVFAERLPNDEWIMRLPRRVRYNTATPAISTLQRLKFYIQSDSTAVFVNSVKYSETDKYELSTPVSVLVRSNFGTERPYKLFMLNYPEFSSFKIGTASGTLVRNQFDYSSFDMEITLPSGTDLSAVKPEFTLTSAAEKAYIGNTEQISGSSSVDLTNGITYRLESALPEDSSVKAISTIKIIILN